MRARQRVENNVFRLWWQRTVCGIVYIRQEECSGRVQRYRLVLCSLVHLLVAWVYNSVYAQDIARIEFSEGLDGFWQQTRI